MIYGRDDDIKKLNQLYQNDNFEFAFIYGERKVGKSALLNEFTKGKQCLFFSAVDAGDIINIEQFSSVVYKFFDIPTTAGRFNSWKSAFDFITISKSPVKYVIVLDNFFRLLDPKMSNRNIISDFVDQISKNSQIFLIMSGDYNDFTENVIKARSSLWGKQSASIKVTEIDFLDVSKMIPSFGLEEKLQFYSCLGGVPQYYSKIDNKKSFEENLFELFFKESGYMYREPEMIINRYIREPQVYNSIIYSIANGNNKLEDIVKSTKEERTKIGKYLSSLIQYNIVYKACPFGDDPTTSRKGRYRIRNNCVEFWYKYVFLNRRTIECGNGNSIAKELTENNNYLEGVDKSIALDICTQYLMSENSKQSLPFNATLFGRWWNSKYDIAVAASFKEKAIIFYDCILIDKINAVEKLKSLLALRKEFKDYKKFYFYLFSSQKFSKEAFDFENANPDIILHYL